MKFDPFVITGGSCIGITFLICFYQTYKHLKYRFQPEIQNRYIVIINLVVVFCITSFTPLFFEKYNDLFLMLREWYDGVCVFLYWQLIKIYTGRDYLVRLLSENRKRRLCKCLCYVTLNNNFLRLCDFAVLQFLICRISLALIQTILNYTDYYHPSVVAVNEPYIYITVVKITSLVFAMQIIGIYLLFFREHMKHYSPVWQFAAIKIMIALSLLQNFLFNLFAPNIPLVSESDDYSPLENANRYRNVIECGEMVLCALMFVHLFNYKILEYEPLIKHEDDA